MSANPTPTKSSFPSATSPLASLVTTLLLQSPPGELKDVLHDLQCLQKSNKLDDSSILDTLVEYNSLNNMEMSTSSGERAIWSPHESEKTRLVDNSRGLSYAVDHLSLTLSDPRPCTASATVRGDSKWTALNAAAKSYCETYFPKGTHLVFAEKIDGVTVMNIMFVSTRFDKNNYWNGRWHSKWTWSPSQLSLRGTVTLFVHSFEEGNVQLDYKDSFASPLASGADAAAVMIEINKHETAFQKTLTKSFETMHEVLYRRLRRVLPVTRSKMDWQKYALYRVMNSAASK